MTNYAVLLGYGLFDKTKVKYKRYLDNFASFVNEHKVGIVVLSGGKTDPKQPHRSEAMSMAEYLKPIIKSKAQIRLENNSLTSSQNIEFSKKFIDLNTDSITIFCDNIRPPKIMWYVLHYWFHLNKKQIEDYFIDYSLEFYKKHLTTEQIGKELSKGISYKNVKVKPYHMRTDIDGAVSNQIASILEINSLYDKDLERKLVRTIKIKFGLK
ncbi:MAG: ElyC/SanA/YdcF family protein [Candidatus Micrarchaeaceae archaeon]|jgi:hypothetical protein